MAESTIPDGVSKCEWRQVGHPSNVLPLGHVKEQLDPASVRFSLHILLHVDSIYNLISKIEKTKKVDNIDVYVFNLQKVQAAGFRIDESSVRRVQYATSYRYKYINLHHNCFCFHCFLMRTCISGMFLFFYSYDGTWNVSSFSPWGKSQGNRPLQGESHPALWNPKNVCPFYQIAWFHSTPSRGTVFIFLYLSHATLGM